jgi:hypothetical protein
MLAWFRVTSVILVRPGFQAIPFERVINKTFPRRCNPLLSNQGGGIAMSKRKNQKHFELTHPNAAGIDIGASSHFVAVPVDRDELPVREFPSFTEDLYTLADWLTACGVDTVAMESTGVYWIPLFEFLESRGFTVYLVNARHVKNVSGRKSDVLDCQWLQQLMSSCTRTFGCWIVVGGIPAAWRLWCVAGGSKASGNAATLSSQTHTAHPKCC